MEQWSLAIFVFFFFCLLFFKISVEVGQCAYRSPPALWRSELQHFAFMSRPTLVPVLTNGKISKEDFHFYLKKKKKRVRHENHVQHLLCGSGQRQRVPWAMRVPPAPPLAFSLEPRDTQRLNIHPPELWQVSMSTCALYWFIFCLH